MKWGTFGAVHIASLIFAAAMIAALYFILKNKSQKTQTMVLGVLSFFGIAAVIFNLLMWGRPLEYLPLHLCSVNALLLPIAVFTRNKTISNLLLVWSLGALAALVMNQAVAEAEMLDPVFCFFYFPHALEFGILILMFKLGLVKKDPKCIVSTVGITMGVYTLIHFFNKALNAAQLMDLNGEVIKVNYMYSIDPENPLLALFYKVIPFEYWYMYVIVPILVVYLLIVYAPQLLKEKQTGDHSVTRNFYPFAIQSLRSTMKNRLLQVRRSTLPCATMGTCASTCSPAFTVMVPRRCPLLTGALTCSSSSICVRTISRWLLSISSWVSSLGTAATVSAVPSFTATVLLWGSSGVTRA